MASDKGGKKVSLPIGGMTCASCVAHVEEALRGVPGVGEAVVNLATGRASVVYDPARVSLTALKKAVEGMGYEVVLPIIVLMPVVTALVKRKYKVS